MTFFILNLSENEFRVPDLNVACTERCDIGAFDCFAQCDVNDSACFSKCLRENDECFDSEFVS